MLLNLNGGVWKIHCNTKQVFKHTPAWVSCIIVGLEQRHEKFKVHTALEPLLKDTPVMRTSP